MSQKGQRHAFIFILRNMEQYMVHRQNQQNEIPKVFHYTSNLHSHTDWLTQHLSLVGGCSYLGFTGSAGVGPNWPCLGGSPASSSLLPQRYQQLPLQNMITIYSFGPLRPEGYLDTYVLSRMAAFLSFNAIKVI